MAISTDANSWEGVERLAAKAGSLYPELTAAQWALESGWGQHAPGNNYFGLKGKGQKLKTKEEVDGKLVDVQDEFLTFESLEDCVNYLVSRWYKDYGRYKGVNHARSREAAALELVKQGYATDSGYAKKLIALMRDHASELKRREVVVPPKALEAKLTIRATQNTFLKKQRLQADELLPREKVWVDQGRIYEVTHWEELAGDGHARVTLQFQAGTWFIYEPHWAKYQPTGEAMEKEVNWDDFNCLVTPHLTVGEVLQWDKRRRPKGAAAARILKTAQEFEKVRQAWGSALGITSWYRPEPINQEVGGVPGSRHTTGEAMDVYPVGRSLQSFYEWIRPRWRGGLGDGRHKGFIHLDMRGGGGFAPGAGVRPAAEWTY